MEKNLISTIVELISTQREDEWWDFKREHHHDKAELVHDILCMANNRSRNDSYIIFGIDNDFSVVGVENDSHRRNQQGITDILRNIAFAGGVRPRIEIQTVTIKNHEIDILAIKDSHNVPYYLEKDYQDKGIKRKDGKKVWKACKSISYLYKSRR